jgi:hypothetical protein
MHGNVMKYFTINLESSNEDGDERDSDSGEISGSHGGEYQHDCHLGCCVVAASIIRAMHRPDDGGSRHL